MQPLKDYMTQEQKKEKQLKRYIYIYIYIYQASRNEKNSGRSWGFVKKCWPTWLGGQKDSSIEVA